MRAGAAGDEHVRVLGAELSAVVEAALERGEAERIERHRVWSAAEPHRPCCGVDVVDGERAQLADRRAVQQREQPDERFVRVAVSACPAAQQPVPGRPWRGCGRGTRGRGGERGRRSGR